MSYSPTLKPCPFCGGQAAYKNINTPYSHGWIGCPKCKAYMNWTTDPRTTVEKWNRRTINAKLDRRDTEA
jgi:Lar family restriction alleviation protein